MMAAPLGAVSPGLSLDEIIKANRAAVASSKHHQQQPTKKKQPSSTKNSSTKRPVDLRATLSSRPGAAFSTRDLRSTLPAKALTTTELRGGSKAGASSPATAGSSRLPNNDLRNQIPPKDLRQLIPRTTTPATAAHAAPKTASGTPAQRGAAPRRTIPDGPIHIVSHRNGPVAITAAPIEVVLPPAPGLPSKPGSSTWKPAQASTRSRSRSPPRNGGSNNGRRSRRSTSRGRRLPRNSGNSGGGARDRSADASGSRGRRRRPNRSASRSSSSSRSRSRSRSASRTRGAGGGGGRRDRPRTRASGNQGGAPEPGEVVASHMMPPPAMMTAGPAYAMSAYHPAMSMPMMAHMSMAQPSAPVMVPLPAPPPPQHQHQHQHQHESSFSSSVAGGSGAAGTVVHSIRVTNLNPSVTATDLRAVFAQDGDVLDVQMGPGKALVSFNSREAAQTVIRKYHDVLVDGYRIKIDLIPTPEHVLDTLTKALGVRAMTDVPRSRFAGAASQW
ncbi:hypothetical protein BC828DRAFT_406856 [Blastocladiella britannica]|nr:hypothetical protein BC828DRAFT_406856 [Blastocladiella britannica]